MTKDGGPALPARPLPEDMIDLVAKEVAACLAAHMEWAYPEATKAVAWKSAKRSMQGATRNIMAEIARAAERGEWEACLADLRARRLHQSKLIRAARETTHD